MTTFKDLPIEGLEEALMNRLLERRGKSVLQAMQAEMVQRLASGTVGMGDIDFDKLERRAAMHKGFAAPYGPNTGRLRAEEFAGLAAKPKADTSVAEKLLARFEQCHPGGSL